MKEKNMAIRAAFLSIVGTILLVVADYFNVFSRLGVDVTNLNLEFLSFVIGNGVVILLFIIAYVLVDRRSIDKEKNKRKTALIILKGIYEHAVEVVELFADSESRLYAAKKCDFDKVASQDPMQTFYRNLPFAENDDTIISFAQEGILGANELETYFDIKREFCAYIDLSFVYLEPQYHVSLNPRKAKLLDTLKDTLSEIQGELDDENE